MRKKQFIINSDKSELEFFDEVKEIRAEKGWLCFKYPTFGIARTVSQNALFHVWLTIAAAFYFKVLREDVTERQIEDMKLWVKKDCLLDNPSYKEFLVTDYIDPKTGEVLRVRSSSKFWGRDGMFHVLTWFQMVAASDGLILESKGDFEKRQLSQVE